MRTDAKWTREQEILRQMTEELLIEQAQKELQNKAARAEAEAEAEAEADRLATFARAEAARLATFAKAEADRQLARERLLLIHRNDLLNLLLLRHRTDVPKLQKQHLQ